jgi:hypothetical protein
MNPDCSSTGTVLLEEFAEIHGAAPEAEVRWQKDTATYYMGRNQGGWDSLSRVEQNQECGRLRDYKNIHDLAVGRFTGFAYVPFSPGDVTAWVKQADSLYETVNGKGALAAIKEAERAGKVDKLVWGLCHGRAAHDLAFGGTGGTGQIGGALNQPDRRPL